MSSPLSFSTAPADETQPVYISGRPFVLRDASHPTQTYPVSERAENIEAVEHRLKLDILREAVRYGGLIMVHEELGRHSLRPSRSERLTRQGSRGRDTADLDSCFGCPHDARDLGTGA